MLALRHQVIYLCFTLSQIVTTLQLLHLTWRHTSVKTWRTSMSCACYKEWNFFLSPNQWTTLSDASSSKPTVPSYGPTNVGVQEWCGTGNLYWPFLQLKKIKLCTKPHQPMGYCSVKKKDLTVVYRNELMAKQDRAQAQAKLF